MSEIIEPQAKKPKTAAVIDNYVDNIVNSKKNLEAVLSDDLYKPIPLIKVYVGFIKDRKDLSKAIFLLNEKLPMKELQHLKRVRKDMVLLCPLNFLKTCSSEPIQNYIESNLRELKDTFTSFKEIEVPLLPPKLKKQHTECTQNWSCNFHPNKYLERLISNNFFELDELCFHRLNMGIALEVAVWYLKHQKDDLKVQDLLSMDTNATVVVDPSSQCVVSISFDNRIEHPVQHSAMLAIDNIAKTQNGGAWTTSLPYEQDLLFHLKEKFPKAKFSPNKLTDEDAKENNNSKNSGPYLCTGYYIYMIREPCLMCSMGLVHARAKRVFFYFDNCVNGALKSKTKLQCIPSLNHHFEVFTGFNF